MVNDEKRQALLRWLDGEANKAKARARKAALHDLAKLVERKHWEHVPQCFAALRYDFGRAPDDKYTTVYDAALTEAEYQHFFLETGRPPSPVLTITEG